MNPSFQSWRALGVLGHPAAVLVGRNGEPIERWYGSLDEQEVLDLAATA